MTTQPTALRLADLIDTAGKVFGGPASNISTQLRRLHAMNQELLAALENLRYEYASHGHHAYCQVGTEEDLLNLVDAVISKNSVQ